MLRRTLLVIIAGAVLAACSSGSTQPQTAPTSPAAAVRPSHTHPLRFHSIRDALAFIETKVDVPILLPDQLPPNSRLDHESGAVEVSRYAEGRIVASLNLLFQHRGSLRIEYGAPTFAGCDRQFRIYRSVNVDGYAAILGTSKGYSGIVWPATNENPLGRYALRGTVSGSRILRLAESMKPVTGLEPSPPPGC